MPADAGSRYSRTWDSFEGKISTIVEIFSTASVDHCDPPAGASRAGEPCLEPRGRHESPESPRLRRRPPPRLIVRCPERTHASPLPVGVDPLLHPERRVSSP
jgi:hypothetical protein